jgi:hypothetical protein
MNQFATLEELPSYFKMVNKVQTSSEPKKDASCQPSFNYFQGQGEQQVRWGSSKPMEEVCPKEYKPHEGTPSHSVWNNMTKRKSIVMSN